MLYHDHLNKENFQDDIKYLILVTLNNINPIKRLNVKIQDTVKVNKPSTSSLYIKLLHSYILKVLIFMTKSF